MTLNGSCLKSCSKLNARYLIIFLLVFILLLTGCSSKKEDDTSDESQKSSYTVGILLQSPVFAPLVDGFKATLATLGYEEGQNITYVVESSAQALAAAIDPAQVDVYLVVPPGFGEDNQLKILQAEVGEKPMLFAPGGFDPVAEGVAESLSRPGKNVTGVLLQDYDEKRFEFLLQALPDARHVLVVYNPTNETGMRQLPAIQNLAEEAGVELTMLEFVDGSNFEFPEGEEDPRIQMMQDIPADVDAIFLLKVYAHSTGWFTSGLEHKVAVSQEGTADFGAILPFMTYGSSIYLEGEQVARMADQVFRGIKVGDLPIEYAELFLTIYQGVADAIGVEVDPEVLAQAQVNYDTVALPTAAASMACTASQTSPGGTNQVCLTTACDALTDSGFVSYADRADVASCSTDNLVGICDAAQFDTYYYDGDPSLLRTGCGFSSGTWTNAGE